MKELVEGELTKVQCGVVVRAGAAYRNDSLAKGVIRKVKEMVKEELMKIQCGIYRSVGRSCTGMTLTVHLLVVNPWEHRMKLFMTFLTSRYCMTQCQGIYHMDNTEQAWVTRCSCLKPGIFF